jgi:hypothetical protein
LALTLFLTPVLYNLLAGFSRPRAQIAQALEAELAATMRLAEPDEVRDVNVR